MITSSQGRSAVEDSILHSCMSNLISMHKFNIAEFPRQIFSALGSLVHRHYYLDVYLILYVCIRVKLNDERKILQVQVQPQVKSVTVDAVTQTRSRAHF